MKTPEELYYEWRQTFDKSLYDGMWNGETITHQLLHQDIGKVTFLAGYKAAHEQALNIISKMDNATDRMLQRATCFSAAQPQWISVKDRLPELNEWVLIHCCNGREICKRIDPQSSNRKGVYAWETDRESFYNPDDVTHWMPLPTPPEEEK